MAWFLRVFHSNRSLEILTSTIIFKLPEKKGRKEANIFCTKWQVPGNCPYQVKQNDLWTRPRKSVSKYNNERCSSPNPKSRNQRLLLILKPKAKSIHSSVHPSIHPSIQPPIHSSVHPFIHLCIHCFNYSRNT